MWLGLILSFVSALQIGQQSILSQYSDQLPSTVLAIASAAFPMGKFCSTAFLAIRPLAPSVALRYDAYLLIAGAAFTSLPISVFLCFGRFLIGCGAGIGFVCATVIIYEKIRYDDRPADFFIMGIAFALSTLIINALPVLDFSYFQTLFFSSSFTLVSGIIYLLFGPEKEESAAIDCSPEEEMINTSDFPATMVYTLMVLNVTIGVPAFLAFSTLVFDHFGCSFMETFILSTTFPLAQILLLLALYCGRFNRRFLVVGGYAVSVLVQGLLLLTSFYSLLPEKHSQWAKSVLLWLLCVISSVPCNTALCIMAEQFTDAKQQMRCVSVGRAIMWILSAISTTTFLPSLYQFGFTITLLPYFLISAFSLVLVGRIYPTQYIEQKDLTPL